MGWYETLSTWTSPAELVAHGFLVEKAYKPVVAPEDVLSRQRESALEHCERCHFVI